MSLLRGLLDRLSLVVLIVAAGATPSFVSQYQQQIGGRLEQVRADLAPFQSIADQRHDGSLQRLVEHHLASSDATFRDEGAAINAMVVEEQRLSAAAGALETDLARQMVFLARNADGDVVASTWSLFEPSFSLTAQGLVFALALGGGAWLLLMGCIACVRMLFVRRRYRRTG